MALRMLTTITRKRIERIIERLAMGESINLKERIELKKYSLHIPFIAKKLASAIKKRKSLDKDGLI